MSSPTKIQASPKGIREGTRVILREITATLNNSPPSKSPMAGNETFKKATPEHEVKVNFAREFADAESYPSAVCPTTVITPAESNSISTASSFQSLTSTLSTKSSSGICVDSPSRSNDNSYNNLNDTGLDDLISACARIRLEDTTTFNADQSFGDVTFASATDELQLDRTVNITRSGTASPVPGNDTQTINTHANETKIISSNSPSPCDLNSTWNSNANVLPADIKIVNNVDNNPALNTSADQISPEYSTATDLHTHFSIKSPVNVINDESVNSSQYLEALESNNLTNYSQVLTLPVSSDCLNDNSKFKKPIAFDKSTVSENVVTGVSFEPLAVDNSTVSGNVVTNVSFEPLAFDKSTVSENVVTNVSFEPIALNNSTVSGNVVTNVSFEPLALDNSTVSKNVVTNVSFEPLAFDKSTVSENVVTGVSFEPLAFDKSTVSENVVTNVSFEPLALDNSTVSGNVVTNVSFEPLAFDKSTVSENVVTNVSFEPLALDNSTVSKNVVTNVSFEPLALDNSTVSKNVVTNVSFEPLAFDKSTVSENVVTNVSFEPLAIDNSTVSENVVTNVSFEPLESEKYTETKFEFFVSSAPAVNKISFDTLSNLETINSLAIETGQEKVIFEKAKTNSTVEFNTIPVLDNTEVIEFDIDGKSPNEFIEGAKNFDKISLDVNKESNERAGDLDSTLLVDDINFTLSHEDLQEALASEAEVKEDKNIITCTAIEGLNLPNDYGDFIPQRQSTTLSTDILQNNINTEESLKNIDIPDSKYFDGENDTPLDAQLDFEKLKLEAETIVKDIHNTTAELEKETFVPASPELFRDPSQVDFFLEKIGNGRGDRLRSNSLFANFDPLASETSMLPQGNGASPPASNDEQNGEKETSLPNIITPKRNPALTVLDRLLFYSPMTPDNIKNVESEKIEPVEKTVSSPVPVIDSAMAGELELVRSTVLQLEEQLEKQKNSYDKQLDEKDKKNKSLQDTINQLQKQLAQEIKNKDQIAVIVDEHEKSISRLVAEREKNRNDIDAEKAFLLEELAETKKHLEASEASFNDVHSKYEKMKQAMVLSNNNEATLRESLENNIEVMKGLQNRYEQIKLHAAARLDKANQDLEVMRKQHESEIIKLRAMLKKEELKCNSLTEMIDQKTKENKELTKILDEVIARVNPSDK